MLTSDDLRALAGPGAAEEIFRRLGYPVAPVDVDPEEWRRGGVALPWNGEAHLSLAARLASCDLFVLRGPVGEELVRTFLLNYAEYNVLTKSIIAHNNDTHLAIFDLSDRKALRRLDVDLRSPSQHSLDRLNLLALGSEHAALPRICDRALGREHLTRQFFQRFRAAVGETAAALRDACPAEAQSAIDNEALLLLSRLLFLSFVQKKGWLNGERRFLVDRLERCIADGTEFFATVLLPLFFGCLNTPSSVRTSNARDLGEIPYLNGGLFEPSHFERKNANLHLPNGLMQRVIEGVFERFDFSVDERDSAGAHVDPEMLGKVFESLMESSERAASGSFYTPRAIVDVLVDRAITSWVGDDDPKAALQRLEAITVLDPACGSGAFLLSALASIEGLHTRLAKAAGRSVPADLRARIVERSLYGVDVKAEAVRLCELRLWLAIVSETHCSTELVRPLPNLDRNILQGNSLLGPADFLGDARRDLYAEWAGALAAQRDLIERYRHSEQAERPALYRTIRANDRRLAADLLAKAIDGDERELARATAPQRDLFGRAVPIDHEYCRRVQSRIAGCRSDLERVEEGALDFFAFDIHFAPVMAAGGFDVVVGNPPWVRNCRIEPRAKKMYSERFPLFKGRGSGAAFHQPDLSLAFFEKSLDLAAGGGVVALLVPSKIATAAYASPLRNALQRRCEILALHDWSDEAKRMFDADTFPLAVVLRKGAGTSGSDVEVISDGECFEVRRSRLATEAGEWLLVPPAIATVLEHVRRLHPALERVLGRKPLMGVKSGDNRAFFVEGAVRSGRLITPEGVAIPLSALCRCARGRDVRRWRVAPSAWMLWPKGRGWRPAPRWLRQLGEIHGFDADRLRLSFVRPEHTGISVVWKDVARGMAAAILEESVAIDGRVVPLIANQTLYLIDAAAAEEAHAIAAVLNSTVFGAMLVSIAERAKDAHYRCFGRTVAQLAFPAAFEAASDRLSRASRQLHQGAGDAEGLDRFVADLYGVTATELELLRRFLARRTGAAR